MVITQNFTKIMALVALSLLFLASNSILCRMALFNNFIDPYSFTFYRIISGALMLAILIFIKEKKFFISLRSNYLSSFVLFLYAISFSYSLVNLDAGLGTLLLFGVVQLTMLCVAIYKGERLYLKKVIGILLAFFGLVYLLFPSSSEDNISYFHVFLMIVSGISWGIYTVLGKTSVNATVNTSDNFSKAAIFTLIFYLCFLPEIEVSYYGVLLAIVSGGITSALGYTIWYTILPQIQIITASIIQLFVPIIAIGLSIIFLDEVVTIQIVVAVVLVSLGVYLSIKK